MTRGREIKCEDPAWLNSPEKAEIDQLLRDIEREEKERTVKQVDEILKQIEKEEGKQKR